MSKKDLTNKVERLEAFEERLGVNFKSISAFLDDYDDDFINLEVQGEMHTETGTELSQDVVIAIAVYDDSDRVVGLSEEYFDSDDFFGFDTFSTSIGLPSKKVAKIRIYPKKG